MGANVGYAHPAKKQCIYALGAWLARAKDTVYQAAADGFVCATKEADTSTVIGYTDSGNPPTVIRRQEYHGTEVCGIIFPVKKNDYWKVTNTLGNLTLFWIPLEP